MACCMLYRGNVLTKDINNAIQLIKNRSSIRFVDWCPTGFKIGINSKPPEAMNAEFPMSGRGVAMLAATTAVQSVFSALTRKFDMMYQKRAFVHWYLDEGMEIYEFDDARTNLAVLEKDYQELNAD